jgi:hypothetical protein
MPAAKRSQKSAIENQQYGFLASEAGQLHRIAVQITQCEIRGNLIDPDFICHKLITLFPYKGAPLRNHP